MPASTTSTQPWPDDDGAPAVAVAARTVLFDACWPFLNLERSEGTHELARCIGSATDPEAAGGLNLDQFLLLAKATLGRTMPSFVTRQATGSGLHEAIELAQPVDLMGSMFEELKARTFGAYQVATPPLALERTVASTGGVSGRLTGDVPQSRKKVHLLVDVQFDTTSFARLPWVLTHELVCHAVAGHSGCYRRDDDTAARQFWDEGFMMRTATALLFTWHEENEADGDRSLEPACGLMVSEGIGDHSNRKAVKAGGRAWMRCRQGLRALDSDGAASRMEITTLELNRTSHDIRKKDLFVERARDARLDAIAPFTDFALGRGDADRVFS